MAAAERIAGHVSSSVRKKRAGDLLFLKLRGIS